VFSKLQVNNLKSDYLNLDLSQSRSLCIQFSRHTIAVMPRCEGLPDGPCPKNVINRTVILTQGDLMLCPSYDAIRFPSTKRTGASTSTKSLHTTTKGSANNAPKKPSVTCSSDEDEPYCWFCNESVDDKGIKCDICSSNFHGQYIPIPKEAFEVLLTIVKFTGWVCTTCRESCKARFQNLETSQAKSAEEIAWLSASLAGL